MLSLLDVRFALDSPSQLWSVKRCLRAQVDGSPSIPPKAEDAGNGVWPQLSSNPISLRTLCKRYSKAGALLRSLATTHVNAWPNVMNRDTIVAELRDRIRDPAIPRQQPTGLCGPFALLFELSRRDRPGLVRAAWQLLETGRWETSSGRLIEAEEELRNEPVVGGEIGQVDWLLAATMRDDENIVEDIDDDANGLESITLWREMHDWTRDILGLKAKTIWCPITGEARALMKAQKAVDESGVAFLLIAGDMIRDGGSDAEEAVWFRKWRHKVRELPKSAGAQIHSRDDGPIPDHWVTYLGGLPKGVTPKEDDVIRIRVWSWGSEFEITGTMDGIGEYLYFVVTGVSE